MEQRFEKSAAQNEQILSELAQTREEMARQKDKDAFLEHISRTIAALRTSVDNISRAQQENALRAPATRRDFDRAASFPRAVANDNLVYHYEGNDSIQALEAKTRAERAEEQRIFASLRQKASQLKAVNSALDREIKKVQREKIEALKKSAEQAKEILSLRDQLTAAEEKFKSFDFEGRIISIKQQYQQKVSRLETELCEISDTCMKQVEEIESLKAENIQLKEVAAANGALQAQLNEKEDAMKALQITIQALRQQRSDESAARLAQAQQAFEAIRTERDELTAKLSASEQELAKVRAEKAQIEKNVQDLVAKINENDAVISGLKEQIEVLSRQNRTLGEEKENLQRQNAALSEAQTRLVQEKEQLCEVNQGLTEEKETLAEQNLSLVQQNEVLSRENKDLTAQQEVLAKDKETLAAQQGAWKQEKEQLTAQTEQLDRSRKELAAQNEALAKEKKSLAAENEMLTKRQEKLSSEKEDLLKEKATLREENKSLAHERKTISAQNENLAREKQKLSAQYETLTEQKKKLSEQNEALSKEKKTLTRDNEDLRSEKQHLEKAKADLAARNEQLASSHAQTVKEKEALAAEAKTLARKTDDLQAKTEQLGQENKALASRLNELREDNKELQSENKQLREQSAAVLAAQLVERKREEALAKQAAEREKEKSEARADVGVKMQQIKLPDAAQQLLSWESSFEGRDDFLQQTDSLLGRIKWSLFGSER